MQRFNYQQYGAQKLFDEADDSDSSTTAQAGDISRRNVNPRRLDQGVPVFTDNRTTGTDVNPRIKKLEAENQALKGDNKKLEAENMALKKEMKTLGDSYKKLVERYEATGRAMDSWRPVLTQCSARLQQLQDDLEKEKEKVADHERHLEEVKPLVEVGERIRLLFIEQERLTYSKDGITREQLDQEKLDQGNEAAHGGNGVADAAVILSLARRGVDVESYKETFLTRYQCTGVDVESYGNYPPKVRELLDLFVSIKAGTGIHGGLGTEQRREDALNVATEIWDRYTTLGWFSQEAAQDQEIDRLLGEANLMLAELKRTYNQRRNNRNNRRGHRAPRARHITDFADTGAAFDDEEEDDTERYVADYDWEVIRELGS
ncbi:hypothetical protein V8E51_008629 [Hyaloscypha variabilis]